MQAPIRSSRGDAERAELARHPPRTARRRRRAAGGAGRGAARADVLAEADVTTRPAARAAAPRGATELGMDAAAIEAIPRTKSARQTRAGGRTVGGEGELRKGGSETARLRRAGASRETQEWRRGLVAPLGGGCWAIDGRSVAPGGRG